MSETEEQNNTEVLRSNIETNEIEISEEDLRDFQRFQAQKEAKKLRAQKKRITKAGQPDKRSESSKANISKAREKVKEYLSMSKAVMDEDTDDEYIEIAVKKKEKKQPVKYLDVVKKDMDLIPKAVIVPTPIQAPPKLKINTFIKL